MEKVTIFKNKGDIFKCQVDVDGVDMESVVVRLCLEFEDRNLFFHGTLSKDGQCTIQVPKLPELKDKEGKISVEAIADSTYFKLFEAAVELKNSVDVKMKEEGFLQQGTNGHVEKKVELAGLVKESAPELEVNPFIPKKKAAPEQPKSHFHEFLSGRKK